MAAANSQEASSSASQCTYDVFLSFRGGDTRKNFTDHLYTALVQAGFHTFRDEDEIHKGENIESKIQKAIQESKISIIVFSKDYVSSRWCLEELVMIMEHKELVGHHVLPVFYDVDPSQVRKQTGSFAEAFARDEEHFQEQKGRVERWRAALREAAGLAGMVLQDGYESQFIQDIVEEVGKKVNRVLLNVDPILVGTESYVELVNLWLHNGSEDVGIASIYGMAGIGKTTIAKIVYNMNFNRFEGSSFLADVREKSEQPNGLVHLQRKLLSDLLKRKADKIYSVDEGVTKIKHVICCKRVLLILDDVDQIKQFNAIIGMKKWFCRGSKIIITTRQKHLLIAYKVDSKFEIEKLNDNQSLQLFSRHAFHQDYPVHGYEKYSKKVLHHCGGLPLALKVLGSSLFGKTIDEWESALQKLKKIVDGEIQKILRISFDSLNDDHDKCLFLDIACFFIGMDIDYIIKILDGCNFYTKIGIRNLVDRGLVTIVENKLVAHQLIRDMGREIVRQESHDNPGKRTRLWDNKDAFAVLSENTGTESIRGLSLDMLTLKEEKQSTTIAPENYAKRCHNEGSTEKRMLPHQGNCSKRHCLSFFSWKPINNGPMNSLSTKAFSSTQNLKLLNLSYVELNGNYEDFPRRLVWLRWHGFSFNSIPPDLYMERLIVLDMRNSNLKNVWNGVKFLGELKLLNLSHSHGLVRTPSFIGLPKLEELVLKDCINLVEVDESIGDLRSLVLLNLEGCESLKRLPAKFNKLTSLEILNVSGCLNFVEFLEELGKLESLKVLHADRVSINQVVPSDDMRNSRWSFWHSIFYSWRLPRRNAQSRSFSFGFLPSSLTYLSLTDCNLSDIPKNLSCLPSLMHLSLSGNPIYCIPESIKSLTILKCLDLFGCKKLQSLPLLPSSLSTLALTGCSSLKRIRNHPTNLYILFCGKLVEVPGLFRLEPIRNIDREILNDLGLVNLESLESIEVEMFNERTRTVMKTTIQVLKTTIQALQERDIFSIFLPGNKVPDWFTHQNNGSSISFDLPNAVVGRKIRGLSLCVVYACTDWKGDIENYYSLLIHIETKIKGKILSNGPIMVGVPKANEDMLWLSHWMIGDQLEGGDQAQIVVQTWRTLILKEWGIHLIYEQEE